MFENLVSQKASQYIISDIKNGTFPRAVLFSGNSCSGKLTAALEVSRVLSCQKKTGEWNCQCPSCLRQKSLTSTNVLLLGPRDCFLEIQAARETFLNAYKNNSSYIVAARYLYLRSIRKLTLRFSSILYQGDKNLSKIGAQIQELNEYLEQLDFPHALPPYEDTEKLCEKINENALKLESDYFYKSIPISQIRNMEEWAYIKSEEGKKTIIIENADSMPTGVRNALLKILEEPPADCLFILLTTRRNAVMPTILSRVRTYTFSDRTLDKQIEVIQRVFHKDNFNSTISDFLLSYLPVPINELKKQADDFMYELTHGSIPNTAELIKKCDKFVPKIELKIFLSEIAMCKSRLLHSPEGCLASSELIKTVQESWENVNLYNQPVQSALENLIREISRINQTYDKIITKALSS